jgi:CHAD domain-containing protein
MADYRFNLPDPQDRAAVSAELTGLFAGVREVAQTDAFDIMDSFDWRLFKNGWLLYRTGNRYDTTDIETDRPIDTLVVKSGKPLRFPWEFPESGFATRLKDVLEMRALILVGRIERQSIYHDLLNNDEKTVARLVLESYRFNGGPHTVDQYRLTPVRGYTKAAKQIVGCLENLGLKPAKRSPALTLLESNGLSPGVYSSKVNIDLQPTMPAAEAVRCIMEQLVSVMHLNLPGVRDDIDSEFLHDFRVSVRRSRSLLGQLKGVLDADTTAGLQKQLKAMGAITGNVRDLDVYLLKKSEYINLVGDFLNPGIVQLFRSLQRKRRYAKDRMIKLMTGADFNAALADLDRFVRSDPLAESTAPHGSRPIGEMARMVIYKRYRRIIKKGRRISDATPDEELHRLRIDCKKLRYLLEFFTSLFPKTQMKRLIKQLKQLQENLGDFNDLSVQQDFLMNQLQSIKPQSGQTIMLAAAIGGLVTRLGIEHQRVRSQFLSVFERFNSAENHQRFKTLFA